MQKVGSQGSELDIEHLSSNLLSTKLEEPFDDSDEEGLVKTLIHFFKIFVCKC